MFNYFYLLKMCSKNVQILSKLIIIVILLTQYCLLVNAILNNRNNPRGNLRQSSKEQHNLQSCSCMGYWECISKNGQVYSYCGIQDSEVCCFVNSTTASVKRRGGKAVKNSTVFSTGIVTSSSPSTIPIFSSAVDEPLLFNRGNGDNDFIITAPVQSTLSSTNLPAEVDYFYTREEGDESTPKEIDSTQASPIECGRQAIKWRLNSEAEFREWPWHVAILEAKGDVYVCGGSLISSDKVLTAAHCLNPYATTGNRRRDASKLKIRLGEFDISTNSEDDPYIEALIERIIVHPGFNNATLVNDIAILKLRREINYAMNIRPICLPTHEKDEELTDRFNGIGEFSKCVVTGWGRTSENSSFSLRLKEIVLPLWNHQKCQRKLEMDFGPSYKLPGTAICAGELGHDACDGDGGGGLSCFNVLKQQWEIVGIVSFGIGCLRIENPGVYTSVLHYTSWIDAFVYLQ